MKYLILTLTMIFSQNAFCVELATALTEAIQSSDQEKLSTKVALRVSEELIEKATFKKGQEAVVVKVESNILGDNTYATGLPDNAYQVATEESHELEAIEKELGSKK
jgi:hypothetical protein